MDAVKEKIRTMCVNYSTLMVECMMNKEFKQKFEANPYPYLNEQVGMKIPKRKEITLQLDKRERRWPWVMVQTPEGWVEIDEALQLFTQPDSLDTLHTKSVADLQQQYKKVTPKKAEEVQEHIDDPIEECKMLIKIPFFDADIDKLGEITFDDAEIVLSAGC